MERQKGQYHGSQTEIRRHIELNKYFIATYTHYQKFEPKGPPLTEVQKRARSLCETASAHVGLMATPIWMRADVWRTLPGTVMGAGR